jgi:hypothetical protein
MTKKVNQSLKFYKDIINSSAPAWMQNTAAVLAILVASKPFLIDTLPGVSEDTKQLIGEWFTYVINNCSMFISIAVIFSKKK